MDYLEPDLLRTFLEAIDAGGVMRAAPRVGRTRAAVSSQMQRLQQAVGHPLFEKVGRRLELTPTGEALAGWAKRLLELNTQALAALRQVKVPERARLGAPQDIVERWLPAVLARSGAMNPALRLELIVDQSRRLAELQREGLLELSVRFSSGDDAGGQRLGSVQVDFYAARRFDWDRAEPLPLALLDAPCVFRAAALEALDRAGVPWRQTVSCPSVSALWAAVAAGLGVTARAAIAVPRGVRPWSLRELGPLPAVAVTLHGGETGGPALRALKRDVASELRARLGQRKPKR